MDYQQAYINCSRQTLIDQVQYVITPKRFDHVLRVEQTAIEIAKSYDLDQEAVSIASLLHDFAKDMDRDRMRSLAQQFWDEPSLDQAGPNVWHGFAAAQIAKDSFGVRHPEILRAIAAHTIGWYQMSPIVQVVYMADYMEPGRDFDGVEQARHLVKKDLLQACRYKMKSTIEHLAHDEKPIFLPTVAIYNHFMEHQK